MADRGERLTPQCNRCRFWCEDKRQRDVNAPDADWGFGDCRRRPPVLSETMQRAMMPKADYRNATEFEPDVVERQQMSLYPATFATDWCGEFADERPEFEGPVA